MLVKLRDVVQKSKLMLSTARIMSSPKRQVVQPGCAHLSGGVLLQLQCCRMQLGWGRNAFSFQERRKHFQVPPCAPDCCSVKEQSSVALNQPRDVSRDLSGHVKG